MWKYIKPAIINYHLRDSGKSWNAKVIIIERCRKGIILFYLAGIGGWGVWFWFEVNFEEFKRHI